MELGKAAAHSPTLYYTNSWDGIGPKDAFHCGMDSWKDRRYGALSSASIRSWSDASSTPGISLSPVSAIAPVDKGIYHEIMEIIPLVETLMQQQQAYKSFPRHGSLVYTSNPRDSLKASELGSMVLKGRGQLFQGNQVDEDMDANSVISQLQDQVQQLEQKLLEKDHQLQAVEINSREAAILQFQAREKELQDKIFIKKLDVEKVTNQLSQTQHEVESLRHLLAKTESDIQASNVYVSELHKQCDILQSQIEMFLLWMESIISHLETELMDEELDNLTRKAESNMVKGKEDMKFNLEAHYEDSTLVEHFRRKYLASLIAAKHNPTEEMLVLVAELRNQLHSSVLISGNSIHG
ncbi:hypothetical protein KP509_20G018400 [Ceratopteris richardii]|uniref:Uncharacterized protein n=1 Tax=Ceratopteris richardii TaxID=49495 RepID=A0A8T2SFL5_CERRI|nr:hypothetical protein KP509_20G018400 [Ceratopteris richardii]